MPHRGCAVGWLPDVLRAERLAGLERVDRHVLRAVVLEDAADVRRPADHGEVAEEDEHPHEALDKVLREVVLDVGRREGRDQQRQQEEQADAKDRGDPEHQGDRPLADLDALLLGLEAGGADQPAGAHDEGLVQDHQATHERPLRGPVAVDGAGVEPLVLIDDPAVGVAQGDRDGVATAHHDAFDERLTAVVEAGHPRSLPGEGPRTGSGSGRRRERHAVELLADPVRVLDDRLPVPEVAERWVWWTWGSTSASADKRPPNVR